MRTRTWLVSVTMLTGMAGVVAAAGCGDDTTPVTPPAEGGGGGGDANKPDTTTTEGGGVMDAKPEAKAEAAACVDAGVNIATFDSGSPLWACYQMYCGATGDAAGAGTLSACSADCTCNTAFLTALQCAATDASQANITACFTPAVMSGTLGLSWYQQCVGVGPLTATGMLCQGGDGGMMMGDGGDAGDATPSDAADGGTDSPTDTGTGG